MTILNTEILSPHQEKSVINNCLLRYVIQVRTTIGEIRQFTLLAINLSQQACETSRTFISIILVKYLS